MQLVREKLEAVGPDRRMVESLAPMWDEERARCGGTGPPAPPPDPPRDPRPLCTTVDIIRAQFQARAYCGGLLIFISPGGWIHPFIENDKCRLRTARQPQGRHKNGVHARGDIG